VFNSEKKCTGTDWGWVEGLVYNANLSANLKVSNKGKILCTYVAEIESINIDGI